MRKKVPTAVLVIAILHFVGGGLGLVGSLCGLAMQGANRTFAGFGGQPGQADVQEKVEKTLGQKIPAYKSIQIGSLVVNLVLSLLMIAGGIGLLQLMTWGRSLSIVYAFLSIANHAFTVVYSFAFTLPATQALFRELAAQDAKAEPMVTMMQAVVTAGVVIGALFVAYPIAVLVIMFRPSTVRAFEKAGDYEQSPVEAEGDENLPWGRLPPSDPPDQHFRSDDR